MIKIAFIIDTIESPTAGTEKQLLLLIRHLDRSRFQPYLCVLRSSEWLENEFNACKLINIGVQSFCMTVSYLNIIRFSSFLRNNQIHILQTHFRDSNISGVMAGKLGSVKAIVSTRRNQGYWHNRFEVLILNVLNKWVTHFLANSENTRQWTAKTEGVDPGRIDVIHNALEIECYSRGAENQRSEFREKLGFSTDVAIVGIVANLRPVKAIDVFIRAAKLVSDSCPDVRFVVVGEGPERDRLEQLCAELGINHLVRFLGKRLDIPEILGNIDIGVLSSNSESFSNSIVEYLAACLPVVCTDVGGAREAVEDGINGYVVQPEDHITMADKIIDILTSGNVVLLGQNSRSKAEELFALRSIMLRYEQFYDRIVK